MAPGTFKALFNKFSPRSAGPSVPFPDIPKSYASSVASTIPTESWEKPEPRQPAFEEPMVEKPINLPWRGENLSATPPTYANAQKCIERWGLLAPYDTSITDIQWGQYFEERSAIEDIHNPGLAEHYKILCAELMQKPLFLVETARYKLGKVILGSRLEEEQKKQIARTICHSVYYLSLAGIEDDAYSHPSSDCHL